MTKTGLYLIIGAESAKFGVKELVDAVTCTESGRAYWECRGYKLIPLFIEDSDAIFVETLEK